MILSIGREVGILQTTNDQFSLDFHLIESHKNIIDKPSGLSAPPEAVSLPSLFLKSSVRYYRYSVNAPFIQNLIHKYIIYLEILCKENRQGFSKF